MNRVALWDAINHYVEACGGDPSKRLYGNTQRQLAVAEVERIVSAITKSAVSATLDEALNSGNGIYKP